MEQSKTQVKDDRAIVQLNTNTGQIRVQALNGWTGILKVPTYMATNEAIVEIENVITVNPDPTPQVLVRPTSITRTALGWAKSPTETVQKYEVRVNNKLVCETESTTCAVKQLIGPKTQVAVTAIGNEGTRSEVQVGKYSPNKRVKVFTINFDEEKWDFTPTAIKKLNIYIDIIRREGFTQVRFQIVLGDAEALGEKRVSKAHNSSVAWGSAGNPEIARALANRRRQPVRLRATSRRKRRCRPRIRWRDRWGGRR